MLVRTVPTRQRFGPLDAGRPVDQPGASEVGGVGGFCRSPGNGRGWWPRPARRP